MDGIIIRVGNADDVPDMLPILREVALLHSAGRPDIFNENPRHHTDGERLKALLHGGEVYAFVAEGESGLVGVLLCAVKSIREHAVLRECDTLVVDDLCVMDNSRGRGIGTALMDASIEFGRRKGCKRLELNVWAFNEAAMRFYRRYGMTTQRSVMEMPLAGEG